MSKAYVGILASKVSARLPHFLLDSWDTKIELEDKERSYHAVPREMYSQESYDPRHVSLKSHGATSSNRCSAAGQKCFTIYAKNNNMVLSTPYCQERWVSK